MTSKLLRKIATHFVKNNLTLGLAESCTGGHISATITSVSGASKYFSGAVVCYANQVKHGLLAVELGSIKKHGAVSQPVAKAMARGARKALGVDWAVAVTGVAGPTGGTPEKPVGLVHFAVAGPGFVSSAAKIFKGTRTQVQKQSVRFALQLLLKSLNH